MVDYNNVIIHRIVEYVKYLLERITERDWRERTITLDNYQVVEDNISDVNTYIREGLTYSFDLQFNYTVSWVETENGEPVPKETHDSFELKIPKLVNNSFIIEGSTRIPTTVMGKDSQCRIYVDRLQFDYDRFVNYTVDDNGKVTLTATVNTDEDEPLIFEGTPESFEENKQFLQFSDYQRRKLMVKLDRDDIPEYVTYDLCLDLIKKGSDRDEDSIIDKRFITTDVSLISTLRSTETRVKILKNLRKKFYPSGIIYPLDIQSAINNFFKVASDAEIEIPPTINPLVYDALKYKVIIDSNVAYNHTFTDIIDVTNTPANNNASRLNELNKCVKLKDDIIYIQCYSYPDFNKVEVPYMEYCTEQVLANTEVDYDNKDIPKKDKYRIKLRLKYREVPSLDKVKYIEPKADDMLSITTRQIPMINISDSVRNMMGTGMSKQAEELENQEQALVYTGHEDEDIDESVMTTTYDEDIEAEIVEINKDAIIVKDANGSVFPYTIRKTMNGLSNSIISFTPKVKVGDIVHKGDILITPTVNKDKGYSLGINTRAAYMYYKGLNYEDAIIVSESYAKKCAVYKMIDVVINVRDTDLISYLKPIGSSVKFGDIICNLQSKVKAKSATQAAYDNFPLTEFMNVNYYQNNTVVPNNTEHGFIVDCKIAKNDDVPMKVEGTSQIIEQYIEKMKTPMINTDIPEKYRNMILDDFGAEDGYAYTIIFRILNYRPLLAGDKLANRWGNKGEVSKVLPDDQMPYDDATHQPVEIIINPASILKRKNPPQLYECLLGKIIHKVYENVIDMQSKGVDFVEIQNFLEQFYGNKFANYTKDQFESELKDKGIMLFRIAVGSYFNKTHDQVVGWAKTLGVEEIEHITDPEFGPIENKILIGDTYMYRLYHTADYDSKVTSSIVDAPEPHMGKGLYRDSGQKLGEMENWALLSRGAEVFAQSQREDLIPSQYSFLNEMLLAGYMINDDKGLPMLSDYRTNIKKLESSEKKLLQ
jgi:DNA-directed RNA polymerase beta subunit